MKVLKILGIETLGIKLFKVSTVSVPPSQRDLQSVPLKVQVVATGEDGSPHAPDVLLGAVHHESVKSIQGQVLLLRNWHQTWTSKEFMTCHEVLTPHRSRRWLLPASSCSPIPPWIPSRGAPSTTRWSHPPQSMALHLLTALRGSNPPLPSGIAPSNPVSRIPAWLDAVIPLF